MWPQSPFTKNYAISAILFFISYIFDCFDGFYARKYNMISNFGDLFDHFRDLTINSVVYFLLFKKYWKLNTMQRYLPFIVIIIFVAMQIHIGCQEVYYDSNVSGSKFLSIFKSICPSQTKQYYQINQIFRDGYLCSIYNISNFICIYCWFHVGK